MIKENSNEALQFVSRDTKTIAELFNVVMVFIIWEHTGKTNFIYFTSAYWFLFEVKHKMGYLKLTNNLK